MKDIKFTLDPSECAVIFSHYFTDGKPNDSYFRDQATGRLDPAFREAIRRHLEANPDEFEVFLDMSRPLTPEEDAVLNRIEAAVQKRIGDSRPGFLKKLINDALAAFSLPLATQPNLAGAFLSAGVKNPEGMLFLSNTLHRISDELQLTDTGDVKQDLANLQSRVSELIEKAAESEIDRSKDTRQDVLEAWSQFCTQLEGIAIALPPGQDEIQRSTDALLSLSEVVSKWSDDRFPTTDVEAAATALRICARVLGHAT
jgi:hypothetical protein